MMDHYPWTYATDALWAVVRPHLPALPAPKRADRPGRPRLDDRRCLEGLLFVAHAGLAWNALPRALRVGSPRTLRRRLALWQGAGCWAAVHAAILEAMDNAGRIDWTRLAMDSSTVRAVGTGADPDGQATGPSPVDRGRPGSKHVLMVAGARALPIAATVEPANRNDKATVARLLAAVPEALRHRLRGATVYADRGYDSPKVRAQVEAAGATARVARTGEAHGSGLGKIRWPVEQAHSTLHNRRSLLVRRERLKLMAEGMLLMVVAVATFIKSIC